MRHRPGQGTPGFGTEQALLLSHSLGIGLELGTTSLIKQPRGQQHLERLLLCPRQPVDELSYGVRNLGPRSDLCRTRGLSQVVLTRRGHNRVYEYSDP